MPNLIQILNNHPELLELDVADIVSALNAKTVSKRDETLLTFRAMTVKYGIEFTQDALARFKAAADLDPLLAATYLAICSTGIDFSANVTHGMIDQLVTLNVFTQEIGDKLKGLGRWSISPVEDQFGEGAVATEEEVTHAVQEIQRQNLVSRVQRQASQVAGQVRNGSITSWEDAVAAFGLE